MNLVPTCVVLMVQLWVISSQLTKLETMTSSGTSLPQKIFFNVPSAQLVKFTLTTRCFNLHSVFVNSVGQRLCGRCNQYLGNGLPFDVSCNMPLGNNQYLYLYDFDGRLVCDWSYSFTLSYSCSIVTPNCYDCSSRTVCTSCMAQYYLLNNKCYPFPFACLAMTGTSCTSCQNGYYVQAGLCRSCSAISKCLTCTSSTNCLTCSSGYLIDSSGKCQPCSFFLSKCLTCSNQATCTSCESGYALITATKTCQACSVTIPNCLVCSDSTHCSSCHPEYAPGLGSGSCLLCSFFMPNCLHCSSNSTCTRCVSGYAVSVAQDCIICANGDPRCISCDGSGNCIGCEYGYGMNPSGLCIACNTNIPNCNDCNTAQSCTQCATGNFLYQYQVNAYHCKSCSPIYSNCLQCNPSVCTKCQSTFALSTSQTCSSCSGFIGNCTDCTDRFTCTQCFVGFAVTNLYKCAQCKTFIFNCLLCTDNRTCTSCLPGFTVDGKICKECSIFMDRCEECSDTVTCTKCQPGYALDALHKCKPCGDFMNSCSECVDNQTCTACSSGLIVFNDLCKECHEVLPHCDSCSNNISCTLCSLGYLTVNGKCQDCSGYKQLSHCQICTDRNTCETCQDLYQLDPYGKCKCLPHLYQVSSYCIDDPNCRAAQRVNQVVLCKFCDPIKHFTLNSNRKCVCKTGYQINNSKCKEICGDSLIFYHECDDGNNQNNDGCSSQCKIEEDFVCQNPIKGMKGASKCKLNRNIKLKVDFTDKIIGLNKGEIYISLDSSNPNLIKFYQSQLFNYTLTHNRSQSIIILDSKINEKGQIVIEIQYNKTIQNSDIGLTFKLPKQSIVSNQYQLKFKLKGRNFPLEMSFYIEEFQKLSQIQFYLVIAGYFSALVLFVSSKFIAVEGINSLQLVFFSILLVDQDNLLPGFSVLLALKSSTGVNQITYQEPSPLNLKNPQFYKFRYLTMCQYFFANNFLNSLILIGLTAIFLVSYGVKCAKNQDIENLKTKPEQRAQMKKMGKFNMFYRKLLNLTFHLSYTMILQVMVSLFIQASFEQSMSPNMMAVNRLICLITVTIIIFSILQNYKHMFMSQNDTFLQFYPMGLQQLHYRRVYFIYLIFNGAFMFLFNQINLFGYPTSLYLCCLGVIYLLFLILYRPYKYSFMVHQFTVVVNHLVYMISLGIITVINLGVKFEEAYLLVYAYGLMAFCAVVIVLMVVRVVMEGKYGDGKVKEEIDKIIQKRIEKEKSDALKLVKDVQKGKHAKKNFQKEKRLYANNHNRYLYQNQKNQQDQIDFLNELNQKKYLSDLERDRIYYQFYDKKPLKYVSMYEEPEKYFYLMEKEKQGIEALQHKVKTIGVQEQKLKDRNYSQELSNIKASLKKQLSLKKDHKRQRREKQKLKQ